MTNLVIDVGNTMVKLAVFADRQLTWEARFPVVEATLLTRVISERKVERAIVSSVRSDNKDLEDLLLGIGCPFFYFHTGLTAGIDNRYGSPETLGADRLAAVIGADRLYQKQNCLVIDAGTCITYDFLSSERVYRGGSISPGIAMRYKAMHTFTGKLPDLQMTEVFIENYGDSTANAMHSGVLNGIFYEVLGFIESYSIKNQDLRVLLCGGDVKFFDRQLKNSIFADKVKTEPNLVLIGLNEVLHHYNV